MRKLILCILLSTTVYMPAWAKTTKANQTHHTIHATGRPYRAFGRAVKTAAVFSFDAFDATVVDPFGVALQSFADGVDMFIGAPLESLPEPFEAVGDGVHYVYLGIDAVGTQLAK